MYKPLQKKSSSWTPTSIQKKSKNFSKPGSSTVQRQWETKSDSQDIPSHSAAAADLLTANIMRSLDTEPENEQSGEISNQEVNNTASRVTSVSAPLSNSPQIQRQEEEGERQNENLLASSVFGRAGAQGRENFVRTQAGRAYQAGLQAPQVDFDGTLNRTVPSQPSRLGGVFDHRWSDQGGGRYNDPGMRLIYGSPSAAESIGEMQAYGSMADKTRVEFNYNASVDPTTGKGGVADISNNLSQLGLTSEALTARKGGQGADFWHRLTGEDPYLHSRALGRGASDAGASGIHVPSATGGNQVNIIPVNTGPSQVTYQQHIPYDASGNPTPAVIDPTRVNSMPSGSAPAPARHPVHADPDYAAHSAGRTQRAGSGRYGALAAGGMAAFQNLRDGELSAADVGSIGINAGVGGLSGMANDALTPRMGGGFRGGLKGGAIVDAVTSGLFSTWDNAGAYERGDIGAGQATANTIVDTGVGVGSGLAGAAAGAAIGSVIPVAGTAVGAGVGFLAGMAGSYLANELAHRSGFTDWAKEGLGGWLGNYDESLAGAWDGIAGARNSISEGVGNAWNGIQEGAGNAWNNASETAGNAWNGIQEGAGNLWNNASETAGNAWNGIQEGAGNLWNNASETAGNTWNGIKEGAGNAWNNASETAGNAWDAVTSWW